MTAAEIVERARAYVRHPSILHTHGFTLFEFRLFQKVVRELREATTEVEQTELTRLRHMFELDQRGIEA